MNQDKIFQYRLSNNELLLLNNLHEIFSNNGFTIGIWPEIYFCDYRDARKKFDLIKENLNKEDIFNNESNYNFNPDYLGVYIYEPNKEGSIIIFKDRIFAASSRFFLNNNTTLSSLDEIISLLKTKVLIHEIGHWLTHSCTTISNEDVMFQFNFLPKIIIESMAQLTVIWSFYKRNSEYECKLESFAREFMPLQPYPYYEFKRIIHMYSPEIILKRYWGIASQMTHLNEQSLFELLFKNESELSNIQLDILRGKRI